MKAQINNQIRRKLILVFIVLSFIAGSFAQKSAIALKEDYNLKQLKSLFEIMNNREMHYTVKYLQLSEVSDAILGSVGSEIEKTNFEPEWTAVHAFMISEEKEELVVEDWMLDENHFRTTDSNDEAIQTAAEEKLVVEDWMLDESHFLTSDANLHSEENITDDELQVEKWMLDSNHWVLGAE